MTVLAALFAALSVSAQTRVGVVAEAGVPGVSGAAGSLNAAPIPLTAPALSVPSLNASLIPSAAPTIAPVAAAVPATEPYGSGVSLPHVVGKGSAVAMQAAVAAISGDKNLTGENAKALSARALGLDELGKPSESAEPVAGMSAASTPDLEPASDGVEHARGPNVPGPRRSNSPPSLADRWHYARLLAQNYYWYSVTHIVNMWPSYKERWEEAKAKGHANVSNPRAFFAHMRVAAISGRFYVLGSAPLEDEQVIAKFRETLIKWYDAPGVIGPKELAAFDGFTERARTYNSERRAPSNMRKHIRDAIIKGATMDPAKLAPFFDSLLVEETARETADFQNKGAQKRILDAFTAVLHQTLAEEPKDAKGRVRAAILLGSFATGSAGPKSDFDVELLTDGGSNARSVAFIKRLTDRWIATGHHARNPVTVHDFPSTPTRGIVDLVHTGDFILVSLEDDLVRDLQRKPGEYTPKMIRADSLRGRINRAIQFGVIVGSTYVGDLRARFGSKPSGH